MKSEEWKSHVPGCFGDADVHFASHPLDHRRAKEMLKAAIDAEASMDEIVEEATRCMKEKGAGKELIRSQTVKIRSLKF
jgi:hypothetical protein